MCDQVTHYVTKLRKTCSKLAETLFKVINKKHVQRRYIMILLCFHSQL